MSPGQPAAEPWWRYPFIVVSSVAVMIAGVIGVILPVSPEQKPVVTNVVPFSVIAGKQCDIHGENLDLVTEVLLVSGPTPTRLDHVPHNGRLLTVTVPADVLRPKEYSLLFSTRRGELVATGLSMVVAGPTDR